MLSLQGAVWGVTGAGRAALVPGGTLTLTLGDAYYFPSLSNLSLPLAVGTPVYAQADSANTYTSYGGVLENHEINGTAYDNISSTTVTLGSLPNVRGGAGSDPARGILPPRP